MSNIISISGSHFIVLAALFPVDVIRANLAAQAVLQTQSARRKRGVLISKWQPHGAADPHGMWVKLSLSMWPSQTDKGSLAY